MSKDRQVYKNHRPIGIILTVIAIIILTIVLAVIILFFWLQKYIVYTQDGLYLDVPWLAEETLESSSSQTGISGQSSQQ